MVKRVLMIAYHYPPVRGSSGLQRTLQFSRYLLEHDWQPIVLTVHPRAYSQTGDDLLAAIPPEVIVERAFAVDAGRDLAIRGKFPGFLAWPDRWSNWWLSAVPKGLGLVRRYRPQVIWSTYPIATAHLIGLTLQRLSGLPWVADFRDPMTEPDFPPDPAVRRIAGWIERRTVAAASRTVFTTPGAEGGYAARYPDLPAGRWARIPNGYDEDSFRKVDAALGEAPRPATGGRVTLVHSGVLYPSERDPMPFFSALARLKSEGRISAAGLAIILRASGHDDLYAGELRRLAIDDIVALAPSLSYDEALREMCRADGLLLFQAANCNQQVPAKAYEYLRAGRPILALSDPAGDTAALMREAGIDPVVDLADENAIHDSLPRFIAAVARGAAPLPPAGVVARYSRQAQAARLADLLNTVVDEQASCG